MAKRKTKEAPTKKDFKRIHNLEPKYTEKLDQLRHNLQESIERTVRINQAFIRELNKTAIKNNRIKHVIKIAEEFTYYADGQRNLIDKKISDIVCYEPKKKKPRKTEEEKFVDYFCQYSLSFGNCIY
ncbi:uncharacterized protein PHALS_09758 [Plasmopara halstedii]|uniref:Uncharacterized protein n=1 Tax=Plasmopara halstedii TaxID=4781 RepID=A0A0P1AFX7_PLAHL|nr:uncharacterized protein PHALS_09758 [Plasmopara halstedii]CEG39516.1 hypothetical protein PHALS_09758 [Plasmopara halstedii]|eukprot:XP_024575885.1 hypothetical protein PHALS_09758 [Plasmopara halstedii]